jgi:hypothetical protein
MVTAALLFLMPRVAPWKADRVLNPAGLKTKSSYINKGSLLLDVYGELVLSFLKEVRFYLGTSFLTSARGKELLYWVPSGLSLPFGEI